jgi:hypothetical protein
MNNSGSTASAAAAAVGANAPAFFADAANPTVAEIAALATARGVLFAALNAYVTGTFAANEADTEATVDALTTAAVEDGIITVAQKTTVDTEFNDAQGADSTTTEAAGDAAAAAVTVIVDAALALNVTYDAAVAANTALIADLNNANDAILDDQGDTDPANDTGVQADINALELLVANKDEAQTNADTLEALNDAIDAAELVVSDQGFVVSTLTATDAGTVGNDVFLVDTAVGDVTLTSFGTVGTDAIYLGDLAYNATEIGGGTGQTLITAAGNVSALEFFLQDTGTDVDVIIETETFGSATGDTVTITLAGVADISDISIADGLLTIA